MSMSRRLLPLFLLVLLSVGCAGVEGPVRAYEGPPRAEAEVATLSAPSALEVLSVDGRKLKLPYGGDDGYSIQLLPGAHRIRAEYREFWGDATNSTRVVSDVAVFDLNVSAGQRLRLDYPVPQSLLEAERFVEDPRIWVEDRSSGARIEPVDIVPRGSAVTVGGPVADGPEYPAVGSTRGSDAATAAEDELLRRDALERLKFWWKLAPAEARGAFRQWLAEQE